FGEKTGFVTNIKNIYEDKEGDLWIDQNRWGIGIYNPDSNKLLFYTDIPSLKNIANLKNVSCITSVPLLNEIWLGSEYYPEIYKVKKDKKGVELLGTLKLTDYVDNSGFPRLFYTDSNHNLWVGTTKGILVKPAKEKILQDTKFPFVDIIGIREGKDGSLWISTRKQGVYNAKISSDLTLEEKNLRNLKTHAEGVISDNIGAICVDDNGLVWMGSQDGDVFTYDPQTNKVENLSDMFDMLEEGIFNIITDQLGHIWISTNKRVIEYDPKNGGIMDYSTMTDVMVNSFMPNSYYKTRSGKILYGGNKGISVFTPYDHLSDNPRRIRTMVSDVKIDGVSSLLEKNNQRFNLRSQIISLNAGDKNIEIDFSSLNYAFPDKIKYAYKMDGVDDDWVYVRGDRQFAFYNQLPKGKRTFYLKTTDVNGLWSNYIAEVQVFKQPAFYETLWAYLFYIVFTLLCLYLFYHRMKRRIQLRHELRIAQIDKEKSEELVQTKLRYFTNISHDLLTPLTIITCLIDDAEMTNGSRISQLTMIRSNVNKLRRLLQQILDFRKVESGNMKLSVSKSDVISFIDDVCKIHFTPLMRKKNQTFTFLTEDRHLMAYFDRDKLDKIVSNLLSNAYKYTANGGNIKLIVDSYWESENHHLRIQVVDTGEGIAPADLENVFKRFYTINKGDESESNGIGLSLTKDLVELHHGTINVESELGKGSTFTVDLPINKDSYQEDELISEHISANGINTDLILEKEALADSQVGEDTQIADVHLLLVEDNEELLFLMEKILSKHYHVLIAKDGLEALNVIKDNEIDIIISDVMMPEMDGLEFCRALKSNLETSHIPIILLTAKNTVEDRIECYNAGADGYISKPFELKILEARINNFIMHKKNKQEEFRSNVEVNIDSLEPSSIDKEFLDKVISVINSNMSEGDFDVVQLADALAVSKSSLYRKMKLATGLSPIEFIRNIRLKHGSQLLKDKSISVAEVAYECGFSNPKYFATCFKEEFGVTPKEYQKSC
ncbi:response regulator, partial [Bacteroides thetaiotaomicron]